MSAEYAIAYLLFLDIAAVSAKSLDPMNREAGQSPADRAWILNTYAECLETVKSAAAAPTSLSPSGDRRFGDVDR